MVNQLLLDIFEPASEYSHASSLIQLRNHGGISYLLNQLGINHRNISPPQPSHSPSDVPSAQPSPSPPHPPTPGPQFLLQNMLLYLLTLSLLSKLLLWVNQLRTDLSIGSEVIGVCFLLFIIYSKRGRALMARVESQSEEVGLRGADTRMKRVRRAYQECQVQFSDIKQGDIVLFSKGDFIEVDGIVVEIAEPTNLEASNSNFNTESPPPFIQINQEETFTGRSLCQKEPIWAAQNSPSNSLDPFVLASSEVVEGEFWVLVCLCGKWTSAARSGNSEAELGGLSDLTATGRTVSLVMRMGIGLLAVILGWQWMAGAQAGYQIYLQLVYMLASLLLYLSYVNHNEVLSFLRKYLREQLPSRGYKMVNPRIIEQLGRLHVMVIEQDCLSENALSKLSQLNTHLNVKIAAPLTLQELYKPFGDDICSQLVFEAAEERCLKDSLHELSQSKFICVPYSELRRYYLGLLAQMRYKVLYISRSREAMGPDVVGVKCSGDDPYEVDDSHREWLRVSVCHEVENVLLQMYGKATMYNRFRQCYFTMLVNSCLQLTMLVWWALQGNLLDLNLNLIILSTTGNRQLTLYTALTRTAYNQHQPTPRDNFRLPLPIQFNLLLFIYYLYISTTIANSNNKDFRLFLLLMANRLFRVEGLVRRYHRLGSWGRLWMKILQLLGIIVLESVYEWYTKSEWPDPIGEALDVLLLPLLVILYSLFF